VHLLETKVYYSLKQQIQFTNYLLYQNVHTETRKTRKKEQKSLMLVLTATSRAQTVQFNDIESQLAFFVTLRV